MKSNHGTPHESVDIVDDTDRILYKTTKQEAHEKGLLHRTIICEVIDSKGKWLLDDHPKHFGEAFYFVLKTFYPSLYRPS